MHKSGVTMKSSHQSLSLASSPSSASPSASNMSRRSDRLLPIHPNNLNKVIRGEWESISQWLCDVLSSGDVLCVCVKLVQYSVQFKDLLTFLECVYLSKRHRVASIRSVVAYI
ncbi:unnamed protein product [Trichobilharzia szidati]|nr:unnamed protein product [Trichobilharzia szidati]